MSRAHRTGGPAIRLSHPAALGLAAFSAAITVLAVSPLAAPAQAASVTPSSAASTVRTSAGSCPAPGGRRVPEATAPGGQIKVYGHGWGHGMGMSQYGAQGAARLGCGYRTILHTYYANTSITTRSMRAPIQLILARNSQSSTLRAESGAVHWTGFGSAAVAQPKGSTWTVRLKSEDGTAGTALLDDAGSQRLFVHKGVPIIAAHSGTVVVVKPSSASRSLRTRYDQARFVRTADRLGVTEIITSGKRTAVQKYLAGLAEVPVSWPVEALKAQVVAARTYLASKYDSSQQAYSVRTTTADQVYTGFSREDADARLGLRWRRAVDATKGQIITNSGRPIEAMYSSSMGGYTENRQYVYGRYGIPYLKAVDDSRWDAASDNPYRSWSKGFSASAFAQRFGFDSVTSYQLGKRGTASRVRNGLRITGVIAGRTVTKDFTGSAAKYRLGLRSTGFVLAKLPAPAPVPLPSP